MKSILTSVVALVLCTIAAQAQTSSPQTLTGDPGAMLIGTFQVQTPVSIEINGKRKVGDVSHEVFVLRTSAGSVEYALSTTSIVPNEGLEIDFFGTREIYRQLANGAVVEAARLGYMPPAGTQTTKVWFESKVQRVGSGIATRFVPCSSYDGVSRSFSVAFAGGEATVTETTGTLIAPTACSTTESVIE